MPEIDPTPATPSTQPDAAADQPLSAATVSSADGEAVVIPAADTPLPPAAASDVGDTAATAPVDGDGAPALATEMSAEGDGEVASGSDAPTTEDNSSAPDAAATPAQQPKAPKPPEMPLTEVANLLKARFPALFTGQPKPLKLRIQADIQERAPGVFTKGALSAFFRRYTGGTSYLLGLTRHDQRFDLDGQPAGELSAEHKALAQEELTRRRTLTREREQQARQAQRGPRAADGADTPAGEGAADGPATGDARPPRGPRPEGAGPRGPRPDGAGSRGPRPEGAGARGPRPDGASPRGPRPDGAGPRGPRPEGAGPRGPRPEGAGPRGPRPEGDGPRGPRPERAPRGPRPEGAAQSGAPAEAVDALPLTPEQQAERDAQRAARQAQRAEEFAAREAHRAAQQAQVADSAERQARHTLLRDFERSPFKLADFCKLKGLTPDAVEPMLALARKEVAANPPPRPVPDDRSGPRSGDRFNDRRPPRRDGERGGGDRPGPGGARPPRRP